MKHAYLVMAHHQIELLQVLLELIDDAKNDIYLHIDKKWKDFDLSLCENFVHKSKIYLLKRRNVTWGGYSQIQLEIDMLKEATKKAYSFYHLLSGVDLPIKSQKYIHDFFENHRDHEFISFDYNQNLSSFSYRLDQYILFQEIYGNKKNVLYHMDTLFVHLQKMLGVHRIKKIPLELKKGANWFSISHEMATFVLKNEKEIEKYFRFSRCCDELFLQTLAYNSEFKTKLYFDDNVHRNYNMRYVDFQRGNPYIFQNDDIPMLERREELFARKFDWNKDKMAILKLREFILGGC